MSNPIFYVSKEIAKMGMRLKEECEQELKEEKNNEKSIRKEKLIMGKELEIFKILKNKFEKEYEILPKISFNSIIINSQKSINTIDYLICEKETYKIKIAILIKQRQTIEIYKELTNIKQTMWTIDIEKDINEQIENLEKFIKEQ